VGFYHFKLSANASPNRRSGVVVRTRMEAIMPSSKIFRLAFVVLMLAMGTAFMSGCADRELITREQQNIAEAQRASDVFHAALAKYEAELAANAERAERISTQRAALRQQIRDLSTQLAVASDATFDALSATLNAARDQLAKIDQQDRDVQVVIDQAQASIAQGQAEIAILDKSIDRSRATISSTRDSLADGIEATGAVLGEVGTAAQNAGVPWAGVATGIVASAATAVAAWARGRKTGKQDGATTVVKAVDAAKINDTVNFKDPTQKALLDANLGAAGKALVDAAQAK